MALAVALLIAFAAGTVASPAAAGVGVGVGNSRHSPGGHSHEHIGIAAIAAAGTGHESAPAGARRDLSNAVNAPIEAAARSVSVVHTADSSSSRNSRTGISPAVRGPPEDAFA